MSAPRDLDLSKRLIRYVIKPEIDSVSFRKMVQEIKEFGPMIATPRRVSPRSPPAGCLFVQGSIFEDAPPEVMFSNPKQERPREFLKAVLQA